MTRGKVTLAYISNDADRKVSYNKRKKGLIKKARELSTLCDVEACAIIYGENEEEPEVWPSREKTKQVLEKFQSLSEYDRTRNMVNQKSFSEQSIEKTTNQFQRLQTENERKELELFMYRVMADKTSLEEFDMSRVAQMKSVIQEIRLEIKTKIEALQGSDGQVNVAANNDIPAITGNASGHVTNELQ